jgi:hypothetical protein
MHFLLKNAIFFTIVKLAWFLKFLLPELGRNKRLKETNIFVTT